MSAECDRKQNSMWLRAAGLKHTVLVNPSDKPQHVSEAAQHFNKRSVWVGVTGYDKITNGQISAILPSS